MFQTLVSMTISSSTVAAKLRYSHTYIPLTPYSHVVTFLGDGKVNKELRQRDIIIDRYV